MNKKTISKMTGIAEKRIQHYTEQGMIPQFKKSVGRGKSREYTKKDVFYLKIEKIY